MLREVGSMNLVDLYYKLEEKWFAFVDAVSEKGIPLDKVVDSLERARVPTFPLLITTILFAVYFSVLFFVPEQPIPTTHYYKLTVKVMNEDGGLIEGAMIKIDGKNNFTDEDGEAVFKLEKGNYTVFVSKIGCENRTENITLLENKVIQIILVCKGVIRPLSMDKTLIPKTPSGELVDSGYAYVYKEGKDFPETYKITNGKVKIHLDESVKKIELVGEDARCTKTLYKEDLFVEDQVINVKMNCEEPTGETVTITVLVMNESDDPVKDIPVRIENEEGKQITTTKNTNDEGIVEFQGVMKGINVVIVAGPYGEYQESRIKINTGEKQEVKLVLKKAEKDKLTTLTVVNESGSPIKYAKVLIYQDKKTVSKGTTDSNGVFKIPLNKGEKYRITIYKEGYYTGDEIVGGVNKTITLDMSKEITFGSLTVYVYLQLESGDLKIPRNTYVYIKDSNGIILPLEEKVRNGVVRFEKLPVGKYTVIAVREGTEIQEESIEIQEGSRNVVKIYLQPLEFQLTVYVKKDSKPVPGAHVVLYQGTTEVSETTTEIDGAAYFFVKEQLDYSVEAKKEIEGEIYIGKERINGYEITRDLEKTVELMAPDYDIAYKGVSQYAGGPFQKNVSLDIAKKYYLNFQVTAPGEDEYVELTFRSEDINVLSVHSELEDICDFQAEDNEITVTNCSDEDISEIKLYIEPKELGITRPELTAEFYYKNELVKKKKITLKLNITTTCAVVDNKYICLKIEGSGVGVITKPYNMTYELKTNYEKPIEYKHTCSEETGSISNEHGKITVTPVKTGACYIVFKANDTEIARHSYEVSPVACEVKLEPNSTYVNGEKISIEISKISTSPEIDIEEVKVKDVKYPSNDYSGPTKGDTYSEGDAFTLTTDEHAGKVKIVWSIDIPESDQDATCSPSEIIVKESPIEVLTKEIKTDTKELLLKNSGKEEITITDVSLKYKTYEVSLSCYGEKGDDEIDSGEKYTCEITEEVLEKLSEDLQGKVLLLIEYQDSRSNVFTHNEQIPFNIRTCEPELHVTVKPTWGIKGEDVKIKLTSAKYINKFCEEETIRKINFTCEGFDECASSKMYNVGDVILDLKGSETENLDKIILTFEYKGVKNTTEIKFIKNTLQVKLSDQIIYIGKDNLKDPYSGDINVNIKIEKVTFGNREVQVKLIKDATTGAVCKSGSTSTTVCKSGSLLTLNKLPVTDSVTLVWEYTDPETNRKFINETTITFKVSGKLSVEVSPTKVDGTKDYENLIVKATFDGVSTPVILDKCLPEGFCSDKIVEGKIRVYPEEAKDYGHAILRWKLEVPKGSNRVYTDSTTVYITNSECSGLIELETTTLMKNDKNEYNIGIKPGNGIEMIKESISCKGANTCEILENSDEEYPYKLHIKDVKSSDNGVAEVIVEFKLDKNGKTCYAPYIIEILNEEDYYEKLYSQIPRVVNTTLLNDITKYDTPKEIAEKFNNGTTYHGEFFNSPYFLAELIVRILEKSDKILEDVFAITKTPEKCIQEGEYDLTKGFQECNDNSNLKLTTTLRNVTIGYVNIPTTRFEDTLKKLLGDGNNYINTYSLERISTGEYTTEILNKQGETENLITCGVYDISITLNCKETSEQCKLEEITFKKVKDASCDITINNFPLFIGQTGIANPSEGFVILCVPGAGNEKYTIDLYTKVSDQIGKFYLNIIGIWDSCERNEKMINQYIKINVNDGTLGSGRDTESYPHLIYIIPDKWLECSDTELDNFPENVDDRYKNAVEETIRDYCKYYKQSTSLLIAKVVDISEEGIGLFFAGDVNGLVTLSEIYKKGFLNKDMFIDEKTIKINP